MMTNQIVALVALVVDVVLLFLVIGSWVILLRLQRETKEKLEEAEQRITGLKRNQAEVNENLEKRLQSLKAVVLEKTNNLVLKTNELVKNLNQLREQSEGIMAEMEGKMGPLKSSLENSLAKINVSQDNMQKIIRENEKEVQGMANSIKTFAIEIKKMKDFIRERTIDLEL
jgi:hypothetical protein